MNTFLQLPAPGLAALLNDAADAIENPECIAGMVEDQTEPKKTKLIRDLRSFAFVLDSRLKSKLAELLAAQEGGEV